MVHQLLSSNDVLEHPNGDLEKGTLLYLLSESYEKNLSNKDKVFVTKHVRTNRTEPPTYADRFYVRTFGSLKKEFEEVYNKKCDSSVVKGMIDDEFENVMWMAKRMQGMAVMTGMCYDSRPLEERLKSGRGTIESNVARLRYHGIISSQ